MLRPEVHHNVLNPNGTAYKLVTWYTDGERRSISPTGAVISKVKGHGREVACWPISRERNVLETQKLVGRLSPLGQ